MATRPVRRLMVSCMVDNVADDNSDESDAGVDEEGYGCWDGWMVGVDDEEEEDQKSWSGFIYKQLAETGGFH